MSPESDPRFGKLRRFNIAMGFLHLIQGALMLALSRNSTLPVQETLFGFDPATSEVYQSTSVLIDLPLGPLVVSSSIMIIIIAMLCGIWELSSLMLIFSLNATMNLFGMMMEKHNQTTKKTDWTSFVYGSFAGLVVWIVVGLYFFGAIMNSTDAVPTFVYFIFFSLAFFFNIFAVNMVLQYRARGKWKDYLHGERMYIVLSLVAKSALAWQVFAGTLR
jgi:hypothetical protein